MGCEKVDLLGGGFAIICSRGRQRSCAYCRLPGIKLCDGPGAKKGKTCDTPMCEAHAFHSGPEVDYCLDHRQVEA